MDRFTNDKKIVIAEAWKQLRFLNLDAGQRLLFQYGKSSLAFDPFVISVIISGVPDQSSYMLYRKVWRQKMDFQRYENLVYNLDWLQIEEEHDNVNAKLTGILEGFTRALQTSDLIVEPVFEEKGITLGYPIQYYLYDGFRNKTFDTTIYQNENTILQDFIAFLISQFPQVEDDFHG